MWRPLGAYAMTLDSTARVHLFEANSSRRQRRLQAHLVAHGRCHQCGTGRTLPPPRRPSDQSA
ncbi:hypothetical protein [Streptomyces violens]|uniref:hypothetical protein n=1 Tax=Streptomyces violens TaxID=66377 RepID=UPI00316AD391